MTDSIPTLADYQWLLSPNGREALKLVAASEEPLHRLASTLRKQHAAQRAGLLLEQADLRRRGLAKFALAGEMFFTKVGLEQSTDEAIARYKSLRFAQAGGTRIADLCCGIGGDLLGLAEVCQVLGVDSDPVVALLAEANLQAAAAHGEVHSHLVGPQSLLGCDAWHIDPDRRSQGRRTTRVEFHSPNLTELEAMLGVCPHAAIKLAPGSQVPEVWQAEAELEWISRRGECRQQVAWRGKLAHQPGYRTATKLGHDGQVVASLTALPSAAKRVAGRLEGMLYEPDPAVLAAGVTDALAERWGLQRVAYGVGYLTGDTAVADGLLAAFCVREVLPLRTKAIAKRLRELQIGSVEIKVRGMKVDPDRLRKELKLQGEAQATLLLFPQAQRRLAVLADRR